MSKDNELGKGLLVGFLTGAAVGSVIALLYAPKTGKELRNDIKDKADDLMQDAEQYFEKAKVKTTDIINEGKVKTEKLVAEAKVKVDSMLQDAEKVFIDAKEKTGSYVATGKDAIEKESDRFKSALKAGVDTYKREA
jgi:gas vesicle protein